MDILVRRALPRPVVATVRLVVRRGVEPKFVVAEIWRWASVRWWILRLSKFWTGMFWSSQIPSESGAFIAVHRCCQKGNSPRRNSSLQVALLPA